MQPIALLFDRPVRYSDGVSIQEALVRERLADRIPDTVLFLEHAPVVTLGRRGRANFVLASREDLARKGVDLVHASRGGDVTFHGPGQLVMYPVLRLGQREADSHGYLGNLEEVAIRTAGSFGVSAFRREGMSGAWTDAGKIAAIGFQIKRWVTLHGMSFNVDVDLAGFSLIVGCGLVGQPVASLKSVLGDRCPSMDQVRRVMMDHVRAVLQRSVEPRVVHEATPEAALAALHG